MRRGDAARCILALSVSLSLAGCRGGEGRQIIAAFESFIEFGMSNEERPVPASDRPDPLPHAHERSRRVDEGGRAGPTLVVEVDLPHAHTSEEARAVLTYELERLLEEGVRRVEVRGLPAGLVRHGGVMGIGRGVAGVDGGTSRSVEVFVDDSAPPLTREQHAALVALELVGAGTEGGGGAAARRRVEQVHGAGTLREALAVARRRYPRRR